MDTCHPYHDWFTASLTAFLCLGLVVSYLPQHYRIVHKGSSEGFSPWFLLLGSTSSASGLLNMVTMQWEIVKCCRAVSVGSCVEMTAGVVQVGLQWLLFTIILVLYIAYYPPHLKYQHPAPDTAPADMRSVRHAPNTRTEEWQLSIVLASIVAVHLFLATLTTAALLSAPASGPTAALTARWATFLGLSSALLAIVQYAPQLVHTYSLGLVGALSIPMMCMQTPGAVGMVLSIALRPGTNWTSWITFAVSGVMQGSLLVMCIVWKLRQRRLGLDDFGRSLSVPADADDADADAMVVGAERGGAGEETPLLGGGRRGKKGVRGWGEWVWFKK